MFSISNREVLASTQMKLKNRVQESMDEVEWDDKELEIDSDFLSGGRQCISGNV